MSTHTHTIARNATKTGSATVPDAPVTAAQLAALAARVSALEKPSISVPTIPANVRAT